MYFLLLSRIAAGIIPWYFSEIPVESTPHFLGVPSEVIQGLPYKLLKGFILTFLLIIRAYLPKYSQDLV